MGGTAEGMQRPSFPENETGFYECTRLFHRQYGVPISAILQEFRKVISGKNFWTTVAGGSIH